MLKKSKKIICKILVAVMLLNSINMTALANNIDLVENETKESKFKNYLGVDEETDLKISFSEKLENVNSDITNFESNLVESFEPDFDKDNELVELLAEELEEPEEPEEPEEDETKLVDEDLDLGESDCEDISNDDDENYKEAEISDDNIIESNQNQIEDSDLSTCDLKNDNESVIVDLDNTNLNSDLDVDNTENKDKLDDIDNISLNDNEYQDESISKIDNIQDSFIADKEIVEIIDETQNEYCDDIISTKSEISDDNYFELVDDLPLIDSEVASSSNVTLYGDNIPWMWWYVTDGNTIHFSGIEPDESLNPTGVTSSYISYSGFNEHNIINAIFDNEIVALFYCNYL